MHTRHGFADVEVEQFPFHTEVLHGKERGYNATFITFSLMLENVRATKYLGFEG